VSSRKIIIADQRGKRSFRTRGDGRGVDRLLEDWKIEAQLRARLADKDYNESEIVDHIANDREALAKAYRRRLRHK
jgi:hypothetical protein